MTTRDEILGELRGVLERASLLDAVIGPAVFGLVDVLAGTTPAVVAGLAVAVVVVVWRLVRRGSLQYALAGVGGTLLASAFVIVTGESETYFLPGIIGGFLSAAGIVISIAVGYPFVALMSAFTRRWPLEWYRHPRIRPAYTVVSWIWVAFFLMRASLQWVLFLDGSVGTLAIVRIATGWPAWVVLLVASYVVGRARLTALDGPSVEEWETDAEPPWEGQRHGF